MATKPDAARADVLTSELRTPIEVELKLRIDRGSLRALRAHPTLAHKASKPLQRQLRSIYFDTTQHLLRRDGAALRVRRVDGKWVQTLKAGGTSAGGLHVRNEWESVVTQPRPDLPALLGLIDDRDLRKLLGRRRVLNELEPVFETRFRRTTWLVRTTRRDIVEVALDVGDIRDGTRSLPLSELELELKEGDPDVLFETALELLERVPLSVEPRSKAERGYALASEKPEIVKAGSIPLAPSMTTRRAIAAITRCCVNHIQANETAVAHVIDPEGVHQMRVGLRRLRFALRMVRDVAPCPESLLGELEWLAKQLGAARDWQVLTGSTLPGMLAANDTAAGLHELLAAARLRTQREAAGGADAVRSERCTRAMLALARWIVSLEHGAESDAALSAPSPKFARRTLRAWRKRVERRAHDARTGGDDERHRWRIAIKKLRYATEFFRELAPERRARAAITALATLQDELGYDNDRNVAIALIRELAAVESALVEPVRFAEGYLTAVKHHHASTVDALWEKYRRLPEP